MDVGPISARVFLGDVDHCGSQFSVRGIVKMRIAQSFRVMVLSEVGRVRLTMAFGADCLQMSSAGSSTVGLSPNRTHEINLAPSLGDLAPDLC